MAWYDGKANLVGIALGDSNVVGVGGFSPGVQTNNAAVKCYATTDTIPYNTSELQWRDLDPNGTSRYDQMYETLTVQETTYIGQVLGGNGAAAMQMASTIQVATECDAFYLYQGAMGGTTADDWANGGNWTTMLAQLPGALAAIPGAPTYADVIYISLGAADHIFYATTPEQYYTNMTTLRAKMIAQGWWVPGTTQIVIQDTPRNGVMGAWNGVELVVTRFNDRITVVDSINAEIQPDVIPVHYTPETLTEMGRRAGDRIIAQIPWQQSRIGVGGIPISIGGTLLRVHSE